MTLQRGQVYTYRGTGRRVLVVSAHAGVPLGVEVTDRAPAASVLSVPLGVGAYARCSRIARFDAARLADPVGPAATPESMRRVESALRLVLGIS